jgi:hypothetical protein
MRQRTSSHPYVLRQGAWRRRLVYVTSGQWIIIHTQRIRGVRYNTGQLGRDHAVLLVELADPTWRR